ncbi:MAG: HEPN domain-containing protein [Acidobacteria bacterium]|jgi:HEPN domain-containing protein|nr:HEPN domain-containing protein [Acidobacteriota bacterium]
MEFEDAADPIKWLRIAEKDLIRVDRALDDDDAEAAGFWLQQAVEKLLKGFLLSKGWKLKKTHDLESLVVDAVAYDRALDEYHDVCEKITNYYVLQRYPPPPGGDLTVAEVRQALGDVRGLVETLRRQITRQPR